MTHSISIVRYDQNDARLGRHVHHDSRSLDYLFLPRDAKPKKVNTNWASSCGPLNQGNLGSCTGNATAQCMNTDFHKASRDQAFASPNNVKEFQESSQGFLTEKNAIDIYSLGTRLDNTPGNYPPTDTGCDGLSVAKAAVQLGFLNNYSHIVSFSSAQAAIEKSPAIQGTVWTKSMFNPVNGLVKVGPINNSTVEGGHEYLMCGIDFTEEVFIFRNSWGDQDKWPGCRPGGYFAISFADERRLLAEQGDVTVLHGVAQTP